MFHPPRTKCARALILIRAGKYVEDIRAEVGCSEELIRYAARSKGLATRRKPKEHKCFSGTMVVQHRIRKIYSANKKINYPTSFAPIPITALRAAGFMGEARLAFRVEGDMIIVSRMPPIHLHESPECGKVG